ncbi:hypothetical protein [Tautonia sociabilis]|uniref:Uncharacterized protein n=1 Tax=Tautonia sociabilis TaxID=2080755 RepID=A0A432MPY8_9BACT|nr:hypothetical protein [Tautonia sociabilis]RUL89410.1 hypothetical protein TsocGM_01150 [Tautonia sociabilis]
MSDPKENRFTPPVPAPGLPVDRVTERDPPICSVTFRYSDQDLRRALAPSARGWVLQPVTFTTLAAVVLAVLARSPEGRWPSEALLPTGIALAGFALIVGAGAISQRWRGRRPTESPFETTFELTPSELIIRESGTTEIRRSWPSIAAISSDRHLIRFDLVSFDTSTGRYVTRPGPVLPIRAFDSEAAASSFLATACFYRASAGPTISDA